MTLVWIGKDLLLEAKQRTNGFQVNTMKYVMHAAGALSPARRFFDQLTALRTLQKPMALPWICHTRRFLEDFWKESHGDHPHGIYIYIKMQSPENEDGHQTSLIVV